MMSIKITAITTCLLLWATIVPGQERIGINTTSPIRSLEIYGVSGQFIRVQSSYVSGRAGIEFVRGLGGASATDWRIVNDGGSLRFQYDDGNFTTNGQEAMRISPTGNTGIGNSLPSSTVHVDGGNQLAFGGAGYLKLGTETSLNLTFDNTQFQALNNGQPSLLSFQHEGGNAYICSSGGGNTYMGSGNGLVGVGTSANTSKLMLQDEYFQLYLQNSSGSTNGWYIGASNDSWASGDNQLLFSPTGSSFGAVLRLNKVTENTGTEAPVMIYNSYNHTLLLDGNEIDTRGTPLYINHNSAEETYINPSGGRVGIGTTSPATMLHVSTHDTQSTLSIQRGGNRWSLAPSSAGTQNLFFTRDENYNVPYGQIHGQTGQWLALSDKTLKENITLLPPVTENLKRLKTYTYQFKSDATHKRFTGIMAQEAALVFPEMVSITEGQYGVAYAQLAAVGIKAVQEQQLLIDSLKEKVARLKQAVLSSAPIKDN